MFVDSLQTPTLVCWAAGNTWLSVPSVTAARGLRSQASSDLCFYSEHLCVCVRTGDNELHVLYHITYVNPPSKHARVDSEIHSEPLGPHCLATFGF